MPAWHSSSNSQLAASQALPASLAPAQPMAAAGAHDGSSSALLPLPLSLATNAPSRCNLVELRTEGVAVLHREETS